MKGLPAELDRMLWDVAESGDAAAFDEFGARFPHLRGELGRRSALVRSLRGAAGSAPGSRPNFRLRPEAARYGGSRAAFAAGGLALAALGVAAFVVAGRLSRPTAPQPSPVVVAPAPQPAPDVALRPAPRQPPIQSPMQQPAPDPLVPSEPAYLRPKDLKLDRARLQSVLAMLGAEGGLRIQIAPGAPNPEIRLEYHGMNTIDILRDLGRRFGFTALDEGDRRVLVVPARDPDAVDAAPSGGEGVATDLSAPPKGTVDAPAARSDPGTRAGTARPNDPKPGAKPSGVEAKPRLSGSA